MDYMTLREASEKWCISTRQINDYWTEDRIPGAVKTAVSGCCLRQRSSHKTEDIRSEKVIGNENFSRRR